MAAEFVFIIDDINFKVFLLQSVLYIHILNIFFYFPYKVIDINSDTQINKKNYALFKIMLNQMFKIKR